MHGPQVPTSTTASEIGTDRTADPHIFERGSQYRGEAKKLNVFSCARYA
jgi:hypothetical protein